MISYKLLSIFTVALYQRCGKLGFSTTMGPPLDPSQQVLRLQPRRLAAATTMTPSKTSFENYVSVTSCNTWGDDPLRIDGSKMFVLHHASCKSAKICWWPWARRRKEAADISSVGLIEAHTGESLTKTRCVLLVVKLTIAPQSLCRRGAIQSIGKEERMSMFGSKI